MELVFTILMSALAGYATLAVLYLLVFSIAGRFRRPVRVTENDRLFRFLVLVPAYREDAVIVTSIKSLLNQSYPPDSFEVVVIADALAEGTRHQLRLEGSRVVEVNFENSTKAKALKAGLEAFDGAEFDLAVVMDADNLVELDFLSRLNRAFQDGIRVAQAHRRAKNLDTPMAVLDGLSEEINNHIFRKGHRVLGLPAALVGSGMVFEFDLLRDLMTNCHAIGGFDKELELALARQGIDVEYLDDVSVFDEKVAQSDIFVNQRRRWLAAQFHYLVSGVRELIKTPLQQWNRAHLDKVFQMVLPPRILLIVLLPALTLLLIPFHTGFAVWFGVLCLLTAVMIGLALPPKSHGYKIIRALRHLPEAAFHTISALFQTRGANKRFIHTAHRVAEINDNRQ